MVLDHLTWEVGPEVPASLQTLVLRDVGGDMNGIDTFDQHIAKLLALRSLALEFNGDHATYPWASLASLPVELTRLCLKQCIGNFELQVLLDDEGFQNEVSNTIRRLDRLQELVIWGVHMCCTMPALSCLVHLTHLSLASSPPLEGYNEHFPLFDGSEFHSMLEVVCQMTGLQDLKLMYRYKLHDIQEISSFVSALTTL